MEKKVPMRTCIACRETREKRELIRIVKTPDGIKYDSTGKLNGRGAYVCKNKDCIAKLKKQKILNKTFKEPVSDEVYDSIMEEIFGSEK